MLLPTPTTNEILPFRTEGFRTLAEGLDYAARGRTGMNFHDSRGELVCVLSYTELRERAVRLARRLAATGMARGERVAVIAETSPDFVVAFFACQYAGLVPVPLPLAVGFGTRQAYIERLRGMLRAADARLGIAGRELLPVLVEAARETAVLGVHTVEELMLRPAAAVEPEPLGSDEPCYIQYSSGSTSFPRGVLVTQRALVANALAIARDGLALRPGDRCTSWLPLYHDMGLVGCCLTPVMTQIPVDYIATATFARRPLLWLELISRNGGTISFAPTFGYELAVRRAQTANGIDRFDLRSWRVAGIGGEMIRQSVLDRFARIFHPAGFDARAFVPSYGLAEATLAVTFAPLGCGSRVDRVRRGPLFEVRRIAQPAAADEAGAVRDFVRCGRPLPGYAVEIRDDQGRPLPERTIGRVCVRGPSLMREYFRDPAATARVLDRGGWLDTGDLGYLVDGELVITGRSKDLIIVGGRNIWPQDLEWAVERIEGVRPGDVCAFAVADKDEGERVVVIVECRLQDRAARAELRREVHRVVTATAGVEATVVLAPPRSLTYTTSGKLSRAAARERWLAGDILDLDAGAEETAAALVAA
ncbi:4-hydroxyphenylalkanoate adenylyltransferase [bacterium HR40]|nr:4-hydroxyphenylalkanoate adenylyltransferase [bacterium HR40]